MTDDPASNRPSAGPANPAQPKQVAPPDRVRVAAAVVWRDGRVLFTQRPPGDRFALMWEFPGGKIEPGESVEHALEREVREELGVRARPLDVLDVERHDYAAGPRVEITFMRCTLDSIAFTPSPAVHASAWWRPGEVPIDRVLEADRRFVRALGAEPRPETARPGAGGAEPRASGAGAC